MEIKKREIFKGFNRILDDSYFHYLATVNYKNLTTNNLNEESAVLNEKQYYENLEVFVEILADRIDRLEPDQSVKMSKLLAQLFVEEYEPAGY